MLFAELTLARLELLDTLRRAGPCSVYGLAKTAERNYSNVHTGVARLEELGLSERGDPSGGFRPASIQHRRLQIIRHRAAPAQFFADAVAQRIGRGRFAVNQKRFFGRCFEVAQPHQYFGVVGV